MSGPTRHAIPRNTELPEILLNSERMIFFESAETIDQLLAARLMTFSALRLSEATNITPGRISQEDRSVLVLGKGAKERWVPLDHATLQMLLAIAQERELKGNDRYFTVTKRTIQNWIYGMAKRSGVTRINIHPHTLRHTGCSLMLANKMPVEMVQRVMGHTEISMTMLYFHTVPALVTQSYYEAMGKGMV